MPLLSDIKLGMVFLVDEIKPENRVLWARLDDNSLGLAPTDGFGDIGRHKDCSLETGDQICVLPGKYANGSTVDIGALWSKKCQNECKVNEQCPIFQAMVAIASRTIEYNLALRQAGRQN